MTDGSIGVPGCAAAEERTWIPSLEACGDLLQLLVRQDTCQPEGHEARMVEAILGILPAGVEVRRIDHGADRSSLVVKLPGRFDAGGIAFAGHVDTVASQGLGSWRYPAHEGRIVDGVLWGRGSADMKGGDAAMLLALSHVVEAGVLPERPVYLCFTADEEASGTGIISVRDCGCLDGIDALVICEPSNEQIGICEKGALWIHGEVTGHACHASRPELGVNAAEVACELVASVRALVDGLPEHPLLGKSSASLTRIEAGVMTNVVPALASFDLDVRLVPGRVGTDSVLAFALDEANRLVRVRDGLTIDLTVTNDRPALETSSSDAFVVSVLSAARRQGIANDPRGIHFYTDASQIVPELGVPFVIAGPGDDKQAHCLDEHIELASVQRFAGLYASLMMG